MTGQCGSLNTAVCRAFFGQFKDLNTVQERAAQSILSGLDTLITSATASGKTAAALAPLIERHFLGQLYEKRGNILYIAPTKALANDLLHRVEGPLDQLRIRVAIRHGDASLPSGLDGVDLLITTPESLDVLFGSNPKAFREARAVVVDEAHLLYNTQRGFQLATLLRRIETVTGSRIQLVALSATMKQPKELWRFLRPDASGEPHIISSKDRREIEAVIRILRTEDDLLEVINTVGKLSHCKVLVFVNSRRVADRLGDVLGQSVFRDAVHVHHSSLSRELRARTEREFARNPRAICVATSTLELGIDIGDIDLVILFGAPAGWESFLQRIGRGNRRNDRLKVACLVPSDDSVPHRTALLFLTFLYMVNNEEFLQTACMDIYGAVVQQMLSVLRERKGAFTRLADLTDTFGPWTHITRQTIDAVADELIAKGFCQRHGFLNRIGADDGFHRLEDMRLLWSNYPLRSREVSLRQRGREIGVVPASNLVRLKRGTSFRFAGGTWEVKKATPGGIDVEPCREKVAAVELQYAGLGLITEESIVAACYEMLSSGIVTAMARKYGSGDEFIRSCEILQGFVRPGEMIYFFDGERYHYLTFAGALLNEVICQWAECRSFDADDFWIRSDEPIRFSRLPSEMKELFPFAKKVNEKYYAPSLFQSILPKDMQNAEAIERWEKSPFFGQTLERLSSAELIEIRQEGFALVSRIV